MAEKMFTDALAKGGKKATGTTGVNSGGNMLAKLKAGAKKVVVAQGALTEVKKQMQKPTLVRAKDREKKREKGLRGFPFHLACANNRLDLVKSSLLSDENYDINERFGEVQETPLMFACYNGHLNIVKALCNYPCDVYATSANLENCMHSACVTGRLDIVEFLTSWVREKPLKTFDEREAIRKYQQKRHRHRQEQLDAGIAEIDIQESDEEVEPDWEDDDADKAEERLINQESKHKATPIMRAALKGHLDVVNLLLERGADVSVEDHHKDTALTIAIAKRHVDVGVSLISAGADKDHKNKFGWTPLMLAAGNGDKTTVQTLIMRGCNVNIDTPAGMTALVVAKARGAEDVVEVLKAAGALEKKELAEAKIRWAKEEEERRNRPVTAEDRPTTSEQRRREQGKIRVL
ncbi:hypothetical protein TrST_g4088 [Triparma strigata]|uniref:Uncharacterized protein n=1 Tax=Triparma strigata TaxID=1606541 RepID=A0A9W7ASQ1_9STRA|nr:hypothetical protein TrST_g4088 [Triparma strigata]